MIEKTILKKIFNNSIWKLFFRIKRQHTNDCEHNLENETKNNDCDCEADYNFSESFNGLDIESAIRAHLAWLHKLEIIVEQQLLTDYDVELVKEDCNCPLGKWIYNQAKESYGDSEIYIALKKSHAKFHRIAAEILTNINNGNIELAKVKFKRDLSRSSDAVQLDLLRLCISVV